jgi:indole-3-glycerol phosphate synthase
VLATTCRIADRCIPKGAPVSVLATIIEAKHHEVAALAPRAAELEAQARTLAPARDLGAALRRPDGRVAVISEIKRRSPSKGDLAPDLDPVATAEAYARGGAAALSVLTDREWFGGSPDDLVASRAAVDLPVLRKDFTVDPVQIWEARAMGADAVLLIVAALLDDGLLAALHATALEAGLAVLVEADDATGVERGLRAGARILGVTNRDLHSFGEDLGVGERLGSMIPADVVAVAESAMRGVDDARRMADAGFDAVLVGEALVRSADPAALVAGMAALTVAARA